MNTDRTRTITDERFALLDLGPAGPPAAPPVPRIEVMPDSLPISQDGRSRALRDQAEAEYAGFAPRAPIYPIGTEVLPVGADNFRQSRRDWQDLPAVGDAADFMARRILGERRHDAAFQVDQLRMAPDGQIAAWNDEHQLVAPLSSRAFGSLVSGALGLRGRDYLRDCPPDLRALNLNHWIERVQAGRRTVLRTRRAERGQEVWAVVGTGYRAFDADRVAAAVAAAAEARDPEARAQVVYNPDGGQIRMDVLWHSDVVAESVVAGEIFKAGVRVRSADDGSRGIVIEAEVHRNLCRNLIIIDVARVREASITHRGEDLGDKLQRVFVRALNRIEHFREAWTAASHGNVLTAYDLTDVRDVFRGLVAAGEVSMPGLSEDTAVDRLYASWSMEPGYTRAAIINAVTRCAHEGAWGWEQDDAMERQGGRLLFAKVWNISA
jgi:hypothetical protein